MIDLETLRLKLYHQLARDGRVDTAADIAVAEGVEVDAVVEAFRALASERHLALDSAGEIVLAHPFATRDFGFSVKSGTTLWWGGCAWDSFAIAHLVPDVGATLVATRCPACGTAHAWNVDRAQPPAGDQVAHFLVPMAQVWDDVVHACAHQQIFCSEACVDTWLAAEGLPKGAVFDLATLWRLSADWYTGRLDRGYRRREPVAAAEYFRSVGLVGSFWGT